LGLVLPIKNNFKMTYQLKKTPSADLNEEFLYLEDEEADKIYAQLKARQFRRKSMEETEMRLNLRMSQ
jgi:hypothetical protein